jgi:hypothetical protein
MTISALLIWVAFKAEPVELQVKRIWETLTKTRAVSQPNGAADVESQRHNRVSTSIRHRLKRNRTSAQNQVKQVELQEIHVERAR